MPHLSFATTEIGLNRTSPSMRLYEKAKKYGVWNPTDIDLTQDRLDWQSLAEDEKDLSWRLTAMFQAGEEAITLDLLPLIMVIASVLIYKQLPHFVASGRSQVASSLWKHPLQVATCHPLSSTLINNEPQNFVDVRDRES